MWHLLIINTFNFEYWVFCSSTSIQNFYPVSLSWREVTFCLKNGKKGSPTQGGIPNLVTVTVSNKTMKGLEETLLKHVSLSKLDFHDHF